MGGTASVAAGDTAIDMDAGLIELLTCPADQIGAAAERYWARFERRSRREVAAYLTELALVAS